jgi:hypothetical protein
LFLIDAAKVGFAFETVVFPVAGVQLLLSWLSSLLLLAYLLYWRSVAGIHAVAGVPALMRSFFAVVHAAVIIPVIIVILSVAVHVAAGIPALIFQSFCCLRP